MSAEDEAHKLERLSRLRPKASYRSERDIQQAIRLRLGALTDCVFFRNNVGQAMFKNVAVSYGLAVGASDLIGVVAGRFAALEVKGPQGSLTADQGRFLDLIRAKGGFGAVVRSEDEAEAAIERCKKGESK